MKGLPTHQRSSAKKIIPKLYRFLLSSMKHSILRRSTLSALLAAAFLPAATAQDSFSYNASISGEERWETSAKWGLESGYPSGEGVEAQLQRISGNKTLQLDDLAITLGKLSVSGGTTGSSTWTISGSGTIAFDNNGAPAEITAASGALLINNKVTAENGIDFTGPYAITIAHRDTVINGGINIKGGTLFLRRSGSAGTSLITLSGETTFVKLGGVQPTGTFTNNFNVGESGMKGIYSDVASNGLLTLTGNIAGGGGVIFGTQSSARNDTTLLTGSNDYEGDTRIQTNIRFQGIGNFGEGSISFSENARTLTYESGNSADLTRTRDGSGARAVTLEVDTTIDVGGNDVSYANAITGEGGLAKKGAGSLTLHGENTFGKVTVADGLLVAASANSLGGSSNSLLLEAAGTLGIASETTVSIGILELKEGATLSFTLAGLSGLEGAPLLLVNGAISGTGNVNVTLTGLPSDNLEAYTLLQVAGVDPVSAGFVLDPALASLGYLEWRTAGDQQFLEFHAIPEPSVTVMGLVISAGVLLYGRTLRKNQ